MEFKNNTQKLEYIRSKIHNDNYANDNYETVCAYIKMIHILIKDKIEGKKENYRVIMCPPKNPGIDAYIVCTNKEHNDVALQIKSGSILNKVSKLALKHVSEKKGLPVTKSYILTWDKLENNSAYDCQNVYSEDVLTLVNFIEKNKEKYSKEYSFYCKIIDTSIENMLFELPSIPIVLDDIQLKLGL